MNKLFVKELKLSAMKLTYFFIAFGLMTLIPNYPILVGTFFVTLGIFQSFQSYRESNDIAYSILLPASKKNIVKAKYLFVMFIELCSFVLMGILVIIRMSVLKDVSIYTSSNLMSANLVYLGYVLIIFGLFNLVFVGGFFKTGYYFAKPFITYIILAFLVISIGEALHFFPGLEILNTTGFNNMLVQSLVLAIGSILYLLFTFIGYNKSVDRFESIDL